MENCQTHNFSSNFEKKEKKRWKSLMYVDTFRAFMVFMNLYRKCLNNKPHGHEGRKILFSVSMSCSFAYIFSLGSPIFMPHFEFPHFHSVVYSTNPMSIIHEHIFNTQFQIMNQKEITQFHINTLKTLKRWETEIWTPLPRGNLSS